MGTNRKVILATGEIYHIFNRGVEKRRTFTSKSDYSRALNTVSYYRHQNPPIKFSRLLTLNTELRKITLEALRDYNLLVEIYAYCLMPNHFHFLLKQVTDNGISKFLANLANSYTKFFNTKYERVGPLFQGAFKAKRIEDDEQLVHVNRYIHLNPASSFLIEPEKLEEYPWSSYPEYVGLANTGMINKNFVLGMFKNLESYKKFVLDRASYTRDLERIRHLILE